MFTCWDEAGQMHLTYKLIASFGWNTDFLHRDMWKVSWADLDLLLEQVDLVLLLDQLLLLLGDLRHTRYVQSHTHLTRMWRTDSVVSGLHSGTQPTNCKSLQNIWILNIHLNIYDISFTVCCTITAWFNCWAKNLLCEIFRFHVSGSEVAVAFFVLFFEETF